MAHKEADELRMTMQQINSFYNNLRASGALKMAQELRNSGALYEKTTLLQNLNKTMVAPYQKIAKCVGPTVPKSVLSDFANVTSVISGIPTKQISQIFPYRFQNNPNFFKQIAKQQSMYKEKMNLWNEYFEKAKYKVDQRYRALIPVINLLSKHGWVITPFFDADQLFQLKGKPAKYCIQYLTEYYSKDNYKYFYHEFDQLLDDFIDEDFDKGYLEQLKRMRKLVQEDFTNSNVLINTAVSILEFKYIEVIGSVDTGTILHQRDIDRYFNHHKNDQRSAFDYLRFYSLLKTLNKFMMYQNFNVGVEKTKFTRHSVQHGRFDPLRYENYDFIKVILLIVATRFCFDIYNLK